MAFETDTINLSMRDSETGAKLTANVYYVEGVVDEFGVQRPLSMSQLLLAICMQRASEVEEKIIAIMDEMNVNTDILEGLTVIEAALVDGNEWAYDYENKDEDFLREKLLEMYSNPLVNNLEALAD